jgi:hypothetical protein
VPLEAYAVGMPPRKIARTPNSEGMFGAARLSLRHTLIASSYCRNRIVPSVSPSCRPSTLPVVYTAAEAFCILASQRRSAPLS